MSGFSRPPLEKSTKPFEKVTRMIARTRWAWVVSPRERRSQTAAAEQAMERPIAAPPMSRTTKYTAESASIQSGCVYTCTRSSGFQRAPRPWTRLSTTR